MNFVSSPSLSSNAKKFFAFALLVIAIEAKQSLAQAPDSWTQKAGMSSAGAADRSRAVGISIGNYGYVGVGWDGVQNWTGWWRYNPSTNVWTQMSDFTSDGGTARRECVSFSVGGMGYLGLGTDGSQTFQGLWKYNPGTNVWTNINNTNIPRYAAVSFVIGNKAYVATGYDPPGSPAWKNDLWEYDPVNDSWTAKTSLPAAARRGAVGFAVGGNGYLGGGENSSFAVQNDFWQYNPQANAWVQKANLPSARSYAAAFTLNGKGYVIGGYSGSSGLSDTWEYDPANNQWVARANFGGGSRYRAVGFSINGKGYVGTGTQNGTNIFGDLYEYTGQSIPPVTYQKTYGDSLDDTDTASYLSYGCPTMDEGYIIASTTKSFGAGGKDIYVIKTDKYGITQWTKTYGNSADNIAASISPAFDGGYIIAGNTRTTTDDILVIKINSSGGITWSKTVAGAGDQRANYAEETSGGYVITGKGTSGTGVALFKLNSVGNNVFTASISRSGATSMEGFSIEQTASGNFVIGGEFKGAGTMDSYLLAATPTGSVFSSMAFSYNSSSSGTELRSTIRQTPDGGFIICGSTNATPSNGLSDFFLIKTDNAATTMQWQKHYGGAQNDFARAVLVTSTGKLLVCGYTKSFGAGNDDAFLSCIDMSGSVLWTKTYGGAGVDRANSVFETADGGFVLFGTSNSFGSGMHDVYVIKTDSLGNSGCNEIPSTLSVQSPSAYTRTSGNNASSLTTATIAVTPNNTTTSTSDLCLSCSFPMGISKTNALCFGVCNGTATAMPNGGTTPYTYSWSTVPVQTTQTATGLCAQVYSVTVTDVNGCSATDTISIKQPLAPVNVFVTNDTIDLCKGFSDTLKATATGGTGTYTYLWSPAAGLSNPNISDPAVSPSATVTYTVTAEDANGCSAQKTVLVNVHSPIVTAGPDVTFCNGNSTTLNATGGITYSWSPNIALSNTSIANPIANPTNTITYMVIGTDALGCSNSDNVTVTPASKPIISASPNPSNICSGSISTLSVATSGGSGGMNYFWQPPSQTGSQIFVSPSANTTYTVIGTDVIGCADTAFTFVNVTQSPVATLSPATIPVLCFGDSIILSVSSSSSPANYQWSTGGSTSAITLTPPIGTTTFSVVVSVGMCSDTVIDSVKVTMQPSASITANSPLTICSGTTVSLSASGGTTYSWSTGSAATSISVTPSSTASYYLFAYSGSCSDTNFITLTVIPTPTASITGPSTVCVGSQASLVGNGSGNYVWSPGGQTTSFISGFASTPGVFGYTLTVSTGTNITCSDVATHTVTVTSAPSVSVTGSSTTLCTGLSPDTLIATNIAGATYSWSSTPPTVPAMPNNDTVIVSPDNPPLVHTYTVLVTSGPGCSATSTFTINVAPGFSAPTVSPTSATYCFGDSILPFVASPSTSPPAAIVWLDATGNVIGTTPVLQPLQSTPVGTYTAYCIQGNSLNCLSYPTTVTLNINPSPVAAAGNDVTICSGHTAHLQATGGTTYLWSPGDYLSDSLVFNPSANPDSTFSYQVLVTDANNCKDIDSITVYISLSDTCGIHIYNGITPNGDGDNDIWFIDGINLYPDNFVEIFNRWGNSVWKGKNYDNRKVVWRGQSELGLPLPAGTYFYVVDVKDLGRFSKWVELTR